MIQKLEDFLINYPGRVFFLLIILSIAPFFINIGLLPLFADEPTRANVALEMILSTNFSVPTIGAEYYYNKPPLYNWILAGFYLITGSYSEFVTRLPAMIPMFLFAISVFYSVVYFLKDKRIAALSALLFLVNGRMLIYDSMLGHIDIFYSWLTYCSFMLIFYFHQQKKWFLLFFVSYVITALTFLAKGLPSIVFQGLTLITILVYSKNFKKLFSWQHILSGIICLLIIGSYFYNYYQYNPNLEGYFSTIWDQSSKRTAADVGLLTSLSHLLIFPFEHLGHLFPASLLLLFCFHKNFVKSIKENPFLSFITLVFFANIWVYWLSPLTRPRYLIMLYPLMFILWSYAYYTYREQLPKTNRILNQIMLFFALAVSTCLPIAYFFKLQDIIPHLNVKLIFLFILSSVITYLIWRLKNNKIIGFISLLILVRLAFSWLVLPYRAIHAEESYFRAAAIEMGTITGKKPFYFYQYHPEELEIPIHDQLIFYIQRTRMQQVKFTENDVKPGYYFTFDRNLKNPDAVLIKSYQNFKLYQIK
jgi:4-amino-4-deoxy-L-arabinose transferase-like glycosyltransferase